MKKYLIYLLFILILILIICCPQELTKGTVWEGEIQGKFGGLSDDSDNDFELFFRSDNSLKAYITIKNNGSKWTITLEGDYTLSNNYEFEAELEGKSGNYDFDCELDGTLNYYSGYGEGEYKMKISGGNPEDDTYENDWELTKVGS